MVSQRDKQTNAGSPEPHCFKRGVDHSVPHQNAGYRNAIMEQISYSSLVEELWVGPHHFAREDWDGSKKVNVSVQICTIQHTYVPDQAKLTAMLS